MPKLFGTDGVRGIANTDLTPELTFKLGRAGANFLKGRSNKIVVGRDTRLSGDLLESSLLSGICSAGCTGVNLGVIPTPAVAFLTRQLGADGGVVISASHNPAEYNGIKFFDKNGVKLKEEDEEKVEELMDDNPLERSVGREIGTIVDGTSSIEKYINHVVGTVYGDLEGIKVAIDCANGAAYKVAPEILSELGAEVLIFSSEPNGVNINDGCGSTYTGFLAEIVKNNDIDVGFAFDGDADRVIAIDENGAVVDGDFIMAICVAHLKESDLLNPNAMVTTVMTNIGLDRCMESKGISVIKTPVGDRHVLQEMIEDKIQVGGEQSGHIIFLNHNTTGDGIITALQLLSVIRDREKPLSELTKVMTRYPQSLKNVRVKKEQKSVVDSQKVVKAIVESEEELGSDGRVLVRPSGTEPLIRVMVEAKSEELAERLTNNIVGAIKDSI